MSEKLFRVSVSAFFSEPGKGVQCLDVPSCHPLHRRLGWRFLKVGPDALLTKLLRHSQIENNVLCDADLDCRGIDANRRRCSTTGASGSAIGNNGLSEHQPVTDFPWNALSIFPGREKDSEHLVWLCAAAQHGVDRGNLILSGKDNSLERGARGEVIQLLSEVGKAAHVVQKGHWSLAPSSAPWSIRLHHLLALCLSHWSWEALADLEQFRAEAQSFHPLYP